VDGEFNQHDWGLGAALRWQRQRALRPRARGGATRAFLPSNWSPRGAQGRGLPASPRGPLPPRPARQARAVAAAGWPRPRFTPAAPGAADGAKNHAPAPPPPRLSAGGAGLARTLEPDGET
jgi:hypothetical protein